MDISGLLVNQKRLRSVRDATKIKAGSPIRLGLFLAAFAAMAALFLRLLPESLMSWSAIQVAAVCLFFVIALLIALAWATAPADRSKASFRPALVIWMFLLASEELFNRMGGDAESALNGKFSA